MLQCRHGREQCSFLFLDYIKRKWISRDFNHVRTENYPFLAALRNKAAIINFITSLLEQDVITSINGILPHYILLIGYYSLWATFEEQKKSAEIFLGRFLTEECVASGALHTLMSVRQGNCWSH